MKQPGERINVFVSSTSKDLNDYRAVARNVILDLDWHPVMMEHFGGSPDATIQACYKKLDPCNLMLLIVAFRQGWVPTPDQGGNGVDSVTAFELAYARQNNIPVLAMLADPAWPGNMYETDETARKWVENFRQQLNLPAVFFNYEPPTISESERLPAFRGKVRELLLSHKERLLNEQAVVPYVSESLEHFADACEGLVDGTDIPFLGTGIYGSGALSSQKLALQLGEKLNPNEQLSLATAAEFCERSCGNRQMFLTKFKRILEIPEAEAGAIPVYDLIIKMDTPRLIVMATCDQTLETRFTQAGKPFVVVTHILHSYDGEHDGKILILRPEGPPQICLADKVNVRDAERVIYRPLGSPFINDDPRLDPELEIDTVVVTETDHLTFLSRLDNEHTGIPSAFTRLFKRRPLLFLGYALDVWQYRLIIHVFDTLDSSGKRSSTLAVRVPDSPMEEIAWRRLGADVITMDPSDFAQRILAEGCHS